MTRQKAQAAMEFLTTYGWMFMIVIAVIAVMSYYGLGNVSDMIPTKCDLSSVFTCGSTYAVTDGSFAFEFTNYEEKAINLTKAVCLFPSGHEQYLTFTSGSNTILVGDVVVIACEPNEANVYRGKEKFSAKLIYVLDEVDPLPRVVNADLIIKMSTNRQIFENQYLADMIPYTRLDTP